MTTSDMRMVSKEDASIRNCCQNEDEDTCKVADLRALTSSRAGKSCP